MSLPSASIDFMSLFLSLLSVFKKFNISCKVYESFCDNDLIRQALAVGCKSFLIVTERMLADHLPGGKFNDPSIQIQNMPSIPIVLAVGIFLTNLSKPEKNRSHAILCLGTLFVSFCI
jgi:hypothetical protein